MENQKIKCDVNNCKWNSHQNSCELCCIQVSCGCDACTCCSNFEEV